MKTKLKNLWLCRKAIWTAMGTIGEASFSPKTIGWHHWAFKNRTLYKDGEVVPDDCTLEMWVKKGQV